MLKHKYDFVTLECDSVESSYVITVDIDDQKQIAIVNIDCYNPDDEAKYDNVLVIDLKKS